VYKCPVTFVAPAELPILWQLEISHYNEKVRWALDHKRIPHVRRALLPGVHAVAARRLTGDCDTTPVLTLDGVSIGDSTRIIEELEARWPAPALYPADAGERRRALELEEFFDEQLGPHIRVAVYQELLPYRDLVLPLFTHNQPWAARTLLRIAFPVLRIGMRRALSINAAAAFQSRALTVAAMDHLERELQPSGYLVGDRFTIADLTAASLFYPIVRPATFPYPSVTNPPPQARAFLDSLAARPGGRWVERMYARHRSAE
jgi:glutathione S-transferase